MIEQLWCAEGPKRLESQNQTLLFSSPAFNRPQRATPSPLRSAEAHTDGHWAPSAAPLLLAGPAWRIGSDQRHPIADVIGHRAFGLHTARKAAAPNLVLGPQVARWCMLSSLSSTTDVVDVSDRLTGLVDERTIVPVRPGAGPPIPSRRPTRRRRPLRRGQRRCRYDRRPWMRRRSRGTLHALCRSPRRRGVDVAARGATGVVLSRARHETRSWPVAAPADAGSTRRSSEHDTRFGAC